MTKPALGRARRRGAKRRGVERELTKGSQNINKGTADLKPIADLEKNIKEKVNSTFFSRHNRKIPLQLPITFPVQTHNRWRSYYSCTDKHNFNTLRLCKNPR